MASGSCQGCEEEDEESLKKLIVRLNNVQEGKQIETLVQILEDMLVFTYADHGNLLSGNCSLPPASPAAAPPPSPPPTPLPRLPLSQAFLTNFLLPTLWPHKPALLRSRKLSTSWGKQQLTILKF